MDVEYSVDGDTVDLIAFRRRGATKEVTEQIYALNPGLAFLGVFLPVGTPVKLPDTPTKKVVRDVPRLWS